VKRLADGSLSDAASSAVAPVELKVQVDCTTIDALDVFPDILYMAGDTAATSMITVPVVKNSDGSIVADPVATCGFVFSTVDIAFPVGVNMPTDTDIAVEGAVLTAQAPTTYTLTYSITSSQGTAVTATTTVSIEIIESCSTIDALEVFPDIAYITGDSVATSMIALPVVKN